MRDDTRSKQEDSYNCRRFNGHVSNGGMHSIPYLPPITNTLFQNNIFFLLNKKC